MDFNSILQQRRSIKPPQMLSDRDIPDSILQAMLEAANTAPTHGLTQPWHFTIFQKQTRQSLADILTSIYQETTPAAEVNPEKLQKLEKNALSAPLVLAILAKCIPNGKIPLWEEIAATSCAVQNLMLKATEQGVASFWASPPASTSPLFAKALGYPETEFIPLGLLFLGYPDPNQKLPTAPKRAPISTRCKYF